jgi:hypothetical protein
LLQHLQSNSHRCSSSSPEELLLRTMAKTEVFLHAPFVDNLATEYAIAQLHKYMSPKTKFSTKTASW